ncbi:MAG: hypothetical protein JKY19_11770 [Alcanivoracaceae bacterium]|nr:hypothetical protein [Alcanivoracaceae bacterium]
MNKLFLHVLLYNTLLLCFVVSTFAQTLSTNVFSLPALTGSGPYDFQRITFDIPFPSGTIPILVVTTTGDNDAPMSLRVFNIDNTGFDVIQTEPTRTEGHGDCGTPTSHTTSCDGAHAAVDAAYLAVTAGLQTLSDDTVIVAGINSTSTVQHHIPGSSITASWDTIHIGTTFANPPVVLTQIQTMNNETNLLVGNPNQITSTSIPFMASAVKNVTTSIFNTAIELVEIDDGNTIFEALATAANEEIGWIAITRGVNGTITFDGTSIGFATTHFGNIRGVENGCNNNTINNIPAACSAPVILASMNTRNGSNGGWVKRCNLSTLDTGSGTDVTIGFQIDEDQDHDTERSHINEHVATVVFCDAITLPVSIEFVDITFENLNFNIDWITSSETNSLAYEIWGKFGSQWKMIDQPVKSKFNTSLDPNYYSLQSQLKTIPDEIFIHHINTQGEKEYFGPYHPNQSYGTIYNAKKIDWNKLNLKNWSQPKVADTLKLNIYATDTGMHRIFAHQIPAFIGKKINSIALTLSGKPIGRLINNTSSYNAIFSAQSYIDFYADKPKTADSLYIKHNVYQLTINPKKALLAKSKKSKPSDTETSYPNLFKIEENKYYDFANPLADPWYQQRVFRSSSNASTNIDFINPATTPHTTFKLVIKLYGVTDFRSYDTNNNGLINNDHHMAIYLNQHQIHEEEFDGHIAKEIEIDNLSSELLFSQFNSIQIQLINDTGYPYDLVHIDSVDLYLESESIAENNLAHLSLFESLNNNSNLQVTGFSSSPNIAYAYKNSELYKLDIETIDEGTVRFATIKNALSYWISDTSQILAVKVKNQQQPTPSLQKNTNYLIIAHPDLMPDKVEDAQLSLFHNYLFNKSLNAQWVNTEAIYDHYGNGFPAPQAIKDYIKKATATNNIEYVLLIGGDSYDYHDNLGIGSISHIPSWYKLTNRFINYTPTDSPYVDLTNNGVPDIAIGRWAVKSVEELTLVINNTVNFAQNKVSEVLTISENTDAIKQINYQQQLDKITAVFPSNRKHSVSLDQLMLDNNTDNPHDIIAIARDNMLNHINSGADLIMFSGHGSPTAWTFFGLLSPDIADQIVGDGESFYLPLSCYTTYYANPSNYSLAHQLIYGGLNGSAGIAGAVTLSNFSNNETIALHILKKLNQGMSIGKATLIAKNKLNQLQYQDVILNWATLAEPSLTFK